MFGPGNRPAAGRARPEMREQMQLDIERLHALLGMTILYVTHDQEEALVMLDRICLMRDGRIEQLGTANDLYFRPRCGFPRESNLLHGVIADGGRPPHAPGSGQAAARARQCRRLPVGKGSRCRARSLADIPVALPIERQVRVELRLQDHRQQLGAGAPARDRVKRRGRLPRDHLERLGNVLAELHQLAPMLGLSVQIPTHCCYASSR